MPGVINGGWMNTIVPSIVVSAAGNSGVLSPPYNAQQMAIIANVTAYTSGTVTMEVQWSNDGVNFYSADQTGQSSIAKDTFANLTAIGTLFKVVNVRAPYYRVTWTTGAYTLNIQSSPVSAASLHAPDGFIQGAGAQVGGPPVVGAVASTTLAATYVQATASTMSAITAVPLIPLTYPTSSIGEATPSRIAFKLNCTGNTWTSSVFEVLWSMTGVAGTTWHADPADTFAATSAAATVIKEVPVRAPYFAIAIATGTPGSATFTADYCVTAL